MRSRLSQVVIRRKGWVSYPVLVAEEFSPGWSVELEPLAACTGAIALCVDKELPDQLRDHVEGELVSVFSNRLTVVEVGAGEELKNISAFADLISRIGDAGVRRDGMVVALGGGSLGDAVGFAASVWHRGVPWVVLPTTLLAQVDSAIGGKVGVNLEGVKNLIGAYHQPVAVACDVSWLRSLSGRDFRSGLGEVIKYGLGMDTYIWDLLKDSLDGILKIDSELMVTLVRRCVSVKARFVALDERDAGLRRHLNLGHTFAHALEGAGCSLKHGEAVALGLVASTRLSIDMGLAPKSLDKELCGLLEAIGLPLTVLQGSPAKALDVMETDKKHHLASRNFVVPTAQGRCQVIADPPKSLVTRALESLFPRP